MHYGLVMSVCWPFCLSLACPFLYQMNQISRNGSIRPATRSSTFIAKHPLFAWIQTLPLILRFQCQRVWLLPSSSDFLPINFVFLCGGGTGRGGSSTKTNNVRQSINACRHLFLWNDWFQIHDYLQFAFVHSANTQGILSPAATQQIQISGQLAVLRLQEAYLQASTFAAYNFANFPSFAYHFIYLLLIIYSFIYFNLLIKSILCVSSFVHKCTPTVPDLFDVGSEAVVQITHFLLFALAGIAYRWCRILPERRQSTTVDRGRTNLRYCLQNSATGCYNFHSFLIFIN